MTGARVQVGIYLNNRVAALLGEPHALGGLVETAVLAEEWGIDFVSVGDSLLAKPRYSPIPVLAAVAVRTRRVAPATGILQPHFRHPLVLAQEWATLDALSGGRTLLGVGLGSGPAEVRQREDVAFGIRRRRPQAFAECLALVKQLWTTDTVTFEGQVYRIRGARLGIRPMQRPHPPILVASGSFFSARASASSPFYAPRDRRPVGFYAPYEHVARWGDGWITNMATPEELAETLASIRAAALGRFGRELRADFRVVLNVFIHVAHAGRETTARREAARMLNAYHAASISPEVFDRWVVYGPPERCAEQLARYVRAGVNDYGFNFLGHGLVTSVKFAQEQPAIVKAVIEGTSEGFAYTLRNPVEAGEILARRFPDALERDIVALQIANTLQLVRTRAVQGRPLGWNPPDEWQRMLDLMTRNGFLPRVRPLGDYFTNRFVGE